MTGLCGRCGHPTTDHGQDGCWAFGDERCGCARTSDDFDEDDWAVLLKRIEG